MSVELTANQEVASVLSKSADLLRQVARPSVPGLRFDKIAVFLHGGVAENHWRPAARPRRVFPDIDPESWNEEQGEVK